MIATEVTLSPSMQHYRDLKEENPDCFLMYRMGDFYEFFFDDAVQCASILGITLTARAKIPMAGIPVHQLDQYLQRLLRAGHRVAICDQVAQRKVKGKIITDRAITQIVTPGTITDSQLLDAKSDCCLLAFHRKGENLGLAWISLTRGTIGVTDTTNEYLCDYLANIRPMELLISEYENTIPENTVALLSRVDDWSFDSEHGYDQLCRHFSLNSLDCFDVCRTDLSTGAAYALLCYIQKTQKKTGEHINQIVRERPEQYLIIDEKTRKHLEITESTHGQDGSTLFALFDHCSTPSGSRWIKRALNNPFRDPKIAEGRFDAIDWLLDVSHQKRYETLLSLLRPMADIERIAARLALKTIRPKEFAALRQTTRQLPSVFERLDDAHASRRIKEIQSFLLLSEELITLLEKVIAEEPATFVRDGRVIREGWDEELDRYRALLQNKQEYIQELRDRERNKNQIPSLKIEYNRIHGYYIEVTPSYRSQVPDYYQRKQSLKNGDRFTIPELTTLEHEINNAQLLSITREKEIYEALIENCQKFIKELQTCGQSLAELDGLCAWALVADRNHYVRPEFCPVPHVEAVDLRHPIIEQHVSEFIPNHIQLTPQRQFLLITGPNMGGKSTYMRQTALLILLAYCGSFVPARWAKVGSIDRIMTRIGASDNIARGQSTFMVEMSEMARILRQATPKSLLLIDEIGRGTSTNDGLSLAQAIMRHIIEQNQSLCLFSTHYFELVHAVTNYPRAFNVYVDVEETPQGIVFLHTIREGQAQKSYGIHVACLAGIPEQTIRYAKRILKTLEKREKAEDEKNQPLLQEESDPPVEKNNQLYQEMSHTLAVLSIDDLTPRQALDILARWKKEYSA